MRLRLRLPVCLSVTRYTRDNLGLFSPNKRKNDKIFRTINIYEYLRISLAWWSLNLLTGDNWSVRLVGWENTSPIHCNNCNVTWEKKSKNVRKKKREKAFEQNATEMVKLSSIWNTKVTWPKLCDWWGKKVVSNSEKFNNQLEA